MNAQGRSQQQTKKLGRHRKSGCLDDDDDDDTVTCQACHRGALAEWKPVGFASVVAVTEHQSHRIVPGWLLINWELGN